MVKKNRKISILNIHIVGIIGIGMSAISLLLLYKEIFIQGSDIRRNQQYKNFIKKKIQVFFKHFIDNIKSVDIVIKSSAIINCNIELQQALKKNIPIISRDMILTKLLKNTYNICISGSHGKTSTTLLIYNLLLSLNPSIICGGLIKTINSNISISNDKFFIIEADESDATFKKLFTNIFILTNLDEEHLKYYKSLINIINLIKMHIKQIVFEGFIIACVDCYNIKNLINQYNKIITYATNHYADIYAVNIKNTNNFTIFDIKFSKKIKKIIKINSVTNIKIGIVAQHNLKNILAAISTALMMGINIKNIKKLIKKSATINRRLTIVGIKNNMIFIDDYAHHPKEIIATIELIKLKFFKHKNILIIFEPHKFSRIRLLYDEFFEVLRNIKILVLTDIYSSGEKEIKNFNSFTIVNDLKNYGKKNVFYCQNNLTILNLINNKIQSLDIVVFMGAGTISGKCYWTYNNCT